MIFTILAYRFQNSVIAEIAVMAMTMIAMLLLTAITIGALALLAMIPLTFWLGLVITGALAYVTYPRSKAARK